MIPQLWDSTGSYLIAWLADTVRCTVKEEKNSTYELILEYSSNGKYALNFSDGMYIRCKANQITENWQMFKIYGLEISLTGNVIVNAEHISYGLSGYIVPLAQGYKYQSVADIANYITTNSYLKLGKYNLTGPLFTATYSLTQSNITNVSELLLGDRGLCYLHNLCCYRDNYNIDLQYQQLEGQSYTHITYGVNLKDYNCTVNRTTTYNCVLPYYIWTKEDGSKKLITIVNNSPTTPAQHLLNSSDFVMIKPLTAGDSYKCLPLNVADVISAEYITDTIASAGYINFKPVADNYILQHKAELTEPKIVTTVDFVNLADTENYKNVVPLQK